MSKEKIVNKLRKTILSCETPDHIDNTEKWVLDTIKKFNIDYIDKEFLKLYINYMKNIIYIEGVIP